MAAADPVTVSAEIDLDAFAANIQTVSELVSPAEVMAVLKANAYGHGAAECAAAARGAGATWIGAATIAEATALRAAGDTGRMMTWLYGVEEDLTVPIAHDVDLGVHSLDQLAAVIAAAGAYGRPARVHLKVDTGLSRNGVPGAAWPAVCAEALAGERAGALEVTGVWSHLAAADEPGHPANKSQVTVFEEAVGVARSMGLAPAYLHLANSAGALALPESRHNLVRLGIAAYGIDPADGDLAARAGVRLRPVMRLRAQLIGVKRVEAGASVSYGWTWTAREATTLGLVPLGYADGIPRAVTQAAGEAWVWVGGRRAPIRGRICMDQFVVDLGPDAADRPGDEVTIWGGDGPSASDWAGWCGTIGYEIVARLGARVPLTHRGE